jgi:hypothetical protein
LEKKLTKAEEAMLNTSILNLDLEAQQRKAKAEQRAKMEEREPISTTPEIQVQCQILDISTEKFHYSTC